MKKEQALGQIRELLAALGAVLVTWGISDGNQWSPVIGVLIAAYSLTWGLLHHRDPATPGRMSWSLVRKFINVLGTALVTYGVLHPDRFNALVPLVAALGPLLAAHFSWVDNNPEDGPQDPGPPLWIFLLALIPLLPSCGTEYPITARATYLDPATGAKVGIDYPADISSPRVTLRLPIQGAHVELRSGK